MIMISAPYCMQTYDVDDLLHVSVNVSVHGLLQSIAP